MFIRMINILVDNSNSIRPGFCDEEGKYDY